MEEDEEDALKVWQASSSFPRYPDDFIKCPLNEEQLKDFYSLGRQGIPSSYSKQEEAFTQLCKDQPLTKPIPTSPNKKAKANMQALGHETIQTRLKVLDEFVGFCVKWLNQPATMELALHPQLVAKYMGFRVARGSSVGTLKNIATNLHQASLLINHTKCPKLQPALDATTMEATKSWYTNLNGKVLASISTHYQAKEKGITLWSVWEATLTRWQALQAKLKVS